MPIRYSEDFKEQAVVKAFERGDKTIQQTADELHLNVFTLKGWLKVSRATPMTETMTPRRPTEWSWEQRFEALMASAGLEGEALNAFCRERGLFVHHLQTWKAEFIKPQAANVRTSSRTAVKSLQDEVKQLKKELQRKEKALAEAAALLVLQKKCQAFWEEKGE